MQQFVQVYNTEHRHSGIRLLTPEQGHNGQDQDILTQRPVVYEQARARHPERWAGNIRNWNPITEVWLNPAAEVIDTPPEGGVSKLLLEIRNTIIIQTNINFINTMQHYPSTDSSLKINPTMWHDHYSNPGWHQGRSRTMPA